MEAGGTKVYIQEKGRIIGFDFLRSIAIFLTLCRHSLANNTIFWQIGWVGVHLFFILSSYLIANILFTEYYKNGKINFFRFFIRRSLKIYPLYYLFILISVYKNKELLFSSMHYKMQLLGQLFHLQNYSDILWYHTWSLAAEEHFYFGLSIILLIYLFLSKQNNLGKLAWLFLLVIIAVPLLRYRATLLYHTDWFMGTHFIMDSFAIGSLLALSKFMFPNIFSAIVQWKHYLLTPIFFLLIPVFILQPGNLFINSIGITMMYLAFALLIVYFLSIEDFSRQRRIFSSAIVQPLASIGIASYSIYLFNVPVKTIIDSIPMIEWSKIPVYFIACIVVRKMTWYLIERPIAFYKSRFLLQKNKGYYIFSTITINLQFAYFKPSSLS